MEGNKVLLENDVEDEVELEEEDEDEVVNGENGVQGVISAKNGFSVPDRIKRKAKRPSTFLLASKEPNANGHATNGVVVAPAFNLRLTKNSRKPRNRFGRGLPKKGGAGGKGTWGRPGSELLAEEDENDSLDPNYDSDNQDYEIKPIVPALSEAEIQTVVQPIILEYFEHGDSNEVALSIEELPLGSNSPFIIVLAVNLAMEHKPSHREMTSVLLADMHGRIFTYEAMGEGFDILLKNLPDIILDTPEAPTILGNFIARAIADDCLPPKFLQSYKGQVECEYARQALDRADILLSMKHGMVRLDNVWCLGGGTRPVKYLVKKMVLLLKEYLSSEDLQEAARCLKDLEVPHFHHELVYEAVVIVLEDINQRTAELMWRLLKALYSSVIITPDQMKRGFERVYEAMPEIWLDCPQAYVILERFVRKCQQSEFIPDELARKLPVNRGRKRVVSEGDGGRFKEDIILDGF